MSMSEKITTIIGCLRFLFMSFEKRPLFSLSYTHILSPQPLGHHDALCMSTPIPSNISIPIIVTKHKHISSIAAYPPSMPHRASLED